MALLPSRLPTPAAVLGAVGSGIRGAVGIGCGTARWLVGRLPVRPGGGRADTPSVPTQTIGTDPHRRHGSRASRSLVR